jgi:hypothetical protein
MGTLSSFLECRVNPAAVWFNQDLGKTNFFFKKIIMKPDLPEANLAYATS